MLFRSPIGTIQKESVSFSSFKRIVVSFIVLLNSNHSLQSIPQNEEYCIHKNELCLTFSSDQLVEEAYKIITNGLVICM